MFRNDVLNIPNQLTIVRIICVPVFIASIMYLDAGRLYFKHLPLIIFVFAIFTDALDGFLARVLKQNTILGTWLDPLADKLLLVSSYILLGIIEYSPGFRIPIWLLVIVISRDVIIGIGFMLIYMMKGDLKVEPSYLGKITTFFQMVSILIILLRFSYFKHHIWAVTGVITVFSGLDYLMKGLGRLE